MDEAAHKIEAHIDRTRERLGSNLRELENKVEAATDWRQQFRARPHLFMGGAFVGAALVAAALRSRSPRRVLDTTNEVHLASASRSGVDTAEQAIQLWNNVRGALLGVAATRITQYIGELVPGFDEHLRRAEQRPDARRA